MPSRLTTAFAGMASCPAGAAAASTAPVPASTTQAAFTPLPGPPPPPTPLFDTITRLSGQGRVDTSLKAAAAFYPGRPSAMVVASAHDYADAIGGARLASSLHAPLLLLDEDDLPGIHPHVIPHLYDDSDGRKSVYLLGGTAAISQSAEDRFRASSGGTYDVVRIAGTNRYDTAALLAEQYSKQTPVGVIGIATGESWPDALVAASTMGQLGGPLLLATREAVQPATLLPSLVAAQPGLHSAVIFGGRNAVSPAVEDQLLATGNEATP